jgi:hypothetical protein
MLSCSKASAAASPKTLESEQVFSQPLWLSVGVGASPPEGSPAKNEKSVRTLGSIAIVCFIIQ